MSIVPVAEGLMFGGFHVRGKIPESVLEWSHAAIAMAHFVVSTDALLVPEHSFVALKENREESNNSFVLDIPVVGTRIDEADRSIFGDFPLGIAVFHVQENIAKTAMLIPGVPEAGLGHSGISAYVDTSGRVHKMSADDDVNLKSDDDIAALAEIFLSI